MEHIETILLGIAGPVILGVFGFLWRVNSKLAAHERELAAHKDRIRANSQQLQKHFEKAFTIRKTVE